MLKKFRGRLSVRDQRLGNLAASKFFALGAPDEKREAAHAHIAQQEASIPPERLRRAAQRDPSKIYEKEVLTDVLQALRRDPRVALVMRQQSGVFVEGNRHIRVGTPGTLDIGGMLMGGRHFEIEIKRPGGKPDDRQAERIEAIKRTGGIAGYATSAAEALALLPRRDPC
jgi:hypothetical protein